MSLVRQRLVSPLCSANQFSTQGHNPDGTMRLLDTTTGQFVLKDPNHSETKYAILSHTWDTDGEQTNYQLREIQKRYAPEHQLSKISSSDFKGGPVCPTRQPSSPTSSAPPVVDGATPTDQAISRLTRSLKRISLPLSMSRFTQLGGNHHHTNFDGHSSRPSTLPMPILSPTRAAPHTFGGSLTSESPTYSSAPLDVHASSNPPVGNLPLRCPPDPQPRSIWDDPYLSPKIRGACDFARANGYQYIWIDSCCIDQASSSELSEAINSMYHWYARADVCYVFLVDVPTGEDHQLEGSCFRRSRWFSRGWTLQELIAPLHVVFLSKDWINIGSKRERASLVTDITAIPFNALLHAESLDKFSVAQRLSWASKRETTRVEDQAYSLLGIFDINMAPLYGEGDRAFRRLQEEILRRIPDQSLFAWGEIGLLRGSWAGLLETERSQRFNYHRGNLEEGASLLAASSRTFRDGRDIEADSHDAVFHRLQYHNLPAPDYDFTPHGIRTKIPVIPLSLYLPVGASSSCPEDIPTSQWYLAILGCHHRPTRGGLLGRICYIPPSQSGVEFLYTGWMSVSPKPEDNRSVFGLVPVSQETIERLQSQIEIKTIHIPHPDRPREALEVARWRSHEAIRLVLERNTCDALLARWGYTATLLGIPANSVHPITHRLTLLHNEHTITIEFGHKLHDNGQVASIFATRVRVTGPLSRPSHLFQDTRDAGLCKWIFHRPWNNQRWTERIELCVGNSDSLPLDLTLDFATQDHYILHVAVCTSTQPPSKDKRDEEKRQILLGYLSRDQAMNSGRFPSVPRPNHIGLNAPAGFDSESRPRPLPRPPPQDPQTI